MSPSFKFAITTAVAFSALSLYDAVYHGVTNRGSVFSDNYGTTWGTIAGGVLSALSFGALAVVLVSATRQIDACSRIRRWIRRMLTVDFAALATIFAIGTPFFGDPNRQRSIAAPLGVMAGIAFAAMFALAFALGLGILRLPDLRVSAVLLVGVVPVIGLTFALHQLAPGFAHPAYAETAVYLGVALLGRRTTAAHSATPVNERARDSLTQNR